MDNSIYSIILRAAPFWELLDINRESSSGVTDGRSEGLKAWCSFSAKANWGRFEKRLEWDGWSVESANYIRSNLRQNPSGLKSGYFFHHINTVSAIISTARLRIPSNVNRNMLRDVPFSEILEPCATVAVANLFERMRSKNIEPNNVLSEDALSDLICELLRRLSNVSQTPLWISFNRENESFSGENISNCNVKTRYSRYVDKHLSSGLVTVFDEYPVLIRLFPVLIDYWIESTLELAMRILNDQKIIMSFLKRSCAVDGSLLPIKKIRTGMSDYHNRGRSVSLLTLRNDSEIIYKPRNDSMTIAYKNIVNKIKNNKNCLRISTPNIIDKTNYSWSEKVQPDECANAQDVQKYYSNIGAHLAFAQMLGTTDLNRENIIANGSKSILIDLETLIESPLPGMDSNTRGDMTVSVDSAGILPGTLTCQIGAYKQDISGLASSQSWPKHEYLHWRHVNTDHMRPESKSIPPDSDWNLPRIQGQAFGPKNYIDDIVRGYRITAKEIFKLKTNRLDLSEILQSLVSTSGRHIFRATATYFKIQQQGLSAECMSDGLVRSERMDVLARAFLHSDKHPRYWPILRDELIAIERMDIPRFCFSPGDRNLALDTCVVPQYFAHPAISTIRTRIENLQSSDISEYAAGIRSKINLTYGLI